MTLSPMEIYDELLKTLSGDLDRDLSELGLTFEEAWEPACKALLIARSADFIDAGTHLQSAWIEGLMTGIRYERARRAARE